MEERDIAEEKLGREVRFKQITVAAGASEVGLPPFRVELNGLTEDGKVYYYHQQQKTWEPLQMRSDET